MIGDDGYQPVQDWCYIDADWSVKPECLICQAIFSSLMNGKCMKINLFTRRAPSLQDGGFTVQNPVPGLLSYTPI